jgi:hypothetical protein
MSVNDWLLVLIIFMLIGVWIFSGWMIKDLRIDRHYLKEAGETKADIIYNDRDIRNEATRIAKAVLMFLVFYPRFVELITFPLPYISVGDSLRMTLVRICVIGIVGLLLFSSAGDRISRDRASDSIRKRRRK